MLFYDRVEHFDEEKLEREMKKKEKSTDSKDNATMSENEAKRKTEERLDPHIMNVSEFEEEEEEENHNLSS